MAQTVVPLYPQDYPSVVPPEKQEEVTPDGHVKNIHYPTLIAYLPEKPKATGCGVIVCPGGGYWIQAAGHEGVDIARMLNSHGIAAFILRYRLPPEYRHPVPMNDAQRAIRMTRHKAAEWGIKPNRIGILGFSAGGHLASTAATHFDSGSPTAADAVERLSSRPDFAVLGYPVIAFSKEYCHSGSRAQLIGLDQPADLVNSLSNDLQVTPQTPPTFLFHSQDDKGVDPRNSIDFFLACKDKGVESELHLFPRGGHGYGLGKPGTGQSQWPALLHTWLEQLGMLKG